MTRITVLLAFLFLTSGFSALAQIEVEKRIEIEKKDGKDNFFFVSKEESGGFISYKTETSGGATIIRHFIAIDNNLEETGASITYSYKASLARMMWLVKDGVFHVVNYSKKGGNIEYRSFDAQTLELTNMVAAKIPGKGYVQELGVGDGAFFILSGQTPMKGRKESYSLTVLNQKTKAVKTIDLDSKEYKSAKIQSFGPSEIKGRNLFQVEYEVKLGKEEFQRVIFLYDETGSVVGNPFVIKMDNDKEIAAFRYIELENKNFLIAGTYSNRVNRKLEGVFSGLMDEAGKVQSIETYSFDDLEKLGMSEAEIRELEAEKKAALSSKKKKRKNRHKNSRALTHTLKRHGDKLYLMNEFYRPVYTYSSDAAGNSTSTFMGYSYEQSRVIAFDESGKALWCDRFPFMVAEMPRGLKLYLRFNPDASGGFNISYAHSRGVVIRSYEDSGELKDFDFFHFSDLNDEEVIKYTKEANISHWYDNFYSASGFQKIKDSGKDEKKSKRKAFFILKFKY